MKNKSLSRLKRIISKIMLYILLAILIATLFIFWLLYYWDNENVSPFYYPYNELEYLGIKKITKAHNNENLIIEIEKLINNSINTEYEEISCNNINITHDQYQIIKAAASYDNNANINDYHCCYISCLCYEDRAIISFKTTFDKGKYCEYDGYTYYDKLYLEKDGNVWHISDVFISPTG